MADSQKNLAPEEKKGDFPALSNKGKKRWILIGGLCIALMTTGGAFLLLAPGILPAGLGKKEAIHAREKEEPKEQGFIYSMDAFVVNLADAESPRYLKVKIDMESNECKENEEYQKRLPQLRDAILAILGSKTYKEIYDSEGKKKLKEEIILKVNQFISHFKVKTIYFMEFVIQ